MIVCLYPGCGTILRQENKVEKFCSVHQRRLVQYDIVYKKGKFHLGRPLTKREKSEGKIRKPMRKEYLLSLTEKMTPEQVLMRIGVKRLDRLL